MVPSTEDDNLTAVSQVSSNIPSSHRLSMEDYHEQTPNSPGPPLCMIDSDVEFPPSYEADVLLQTPHLRRKFNIQPREDEGREVLPSYSSGISLENVFSRKMELEGAIHRAHDRNWHRVYASLQGTALTFHKYKSFGYVSTWSSKNERQDIAVEEKRDGFLKSYNLQHADVGVAADYYKKRYVIRVRAEADQFLLSCFKLETFVHWLQSLFAAIDIAPPLDIRPLPRDFSIPRSRRQVTCSTSLTDLDRRAMLAREQFVILRRRYSRSVDAVTPEETSETVTTPEQLQRPSTSHSQSEPLPSGALTPSESFSRLHSQFTNTAFQSLSMQLSTSETHPSISPETGKWRPQHQWSAIYDIMYAKRCMAVLTNQCPRKSNLVIMKGKQWNVDWATGALTRCEPPDYGECVRNIGG